MNTPLGRLEHIQYREAAFYTDDGRAGSIDVMRLHFMAPDAEMHTFDLPNGDWVIDNAALQFLAKYDYRPTDLDETMNDCHDDQILLPLVQDQDGNWYLHQNAMSDAQRALKEAEWFGTDDDEDGDSGPDNGPNAPPGPDPGTGNRGGVDIEEAGEESDAGVIVKA